MELEGCSVLNLPSLTVLREMSNSRDSGRVRFFLLGGWRGNSNATVNGRASSSSCCLTCETLYFLQQEKCLHIVEGLLHMKKKRKKKLLSQMWHYTFFKLNP